MTGARQVAVSLRHAALVTHRGEMYTWGHGTGGKLGLGNHQNADSPQRVYTLWGKSVKRVSCGGQPCTALPCLALPCPALPCPALPCRPLTLLLTDTDTHHCWAMCPR